MNLIIRFLIRIFSRLLLLYPVNFRKDFAEEMPVVFDDTITAAARKGISSLLFSSMRELWGLMISILLERWDEFEKKVGNMNSSEDKKSSLDGRTKVSTKSAMLATLPFVLFGLTCLIAHIQIPFVGIYSYLVFVVIVLLGLTIGFVKNFPTWAYSYLGWSIVMAWWWMMMPVDTFSGIYSPATHNQLMGWRSWMILLLASGIGLLIARSMRPLRQLWQGLGEDWTLLSFMMYAFGAFTQLIYDENHHPYLIVFMLGSTLAISVGAWFYLRNGNIWKKLLSLLSGFVVAHIIGSVCYATWDWAAYYGFPEAPPQSWYAISVSTMIPLLFWIAILFWPAVVGLLQYIFRKNRVA